MADEPQIESGEDRNNGEVLEIRFQKNPNQKLKYLEAEPKILGVAQIALAMFYISVIMVLCANGMDILSTFSCIAPLITIIAGSLAIAAQNLHLPTLKACLGMQVVGCVFSVLFILVHLSFPFNEIHCWVPGHESAQETICTHLKPVYEKYQALEKLMLAVLIALSATVAAYCCKVIQCCTPTSSMPVITVNRPPDPR